MCLEIGSPVEIQNPTHWQSNALSKTAPPPVSSPSSILSPSPHHIFFPARTNLARFTSVTISVI